MYEVDRINIFNFGSNIMYSWNDLYHGLDFDRVLDRGIFNGYSISCDNVSTEKGGDY